MQESIKDKKLNPVSWVSTTYFAMGLPLIFISQILSIAYKDLGVDNATITKVTSALILPWSLKPLFSIFMETFLNKRFYQITTEAITAILFAFMAFALPFDVPVMLNITIALCAVMAVSGSMHDIAGDGIYLEELNVSEQSKFAGWQGAFYNMAKVLGNGILISLVGYLSKEYGLINAWITAFIIMAVIMGAVAIYHIFVLPKSKITRDKNESLASKFKDMIDLFVSFFQKKYIAIYLLFIFLYRFGEGLAIKIAPLFLKDGLDAGGLAMSNEEYGLIYGIFGTIAFISGSILAGSVVSNYGLRKTLFALVMTFNIPFAVYMLLAIYQPVDYVISFELFSNIFSIKWVVAIGVVFEYFSYGFGFVGLTLFMMQQVAPGKYQMAHYAFANSLMNLSIIVPGWFAGDIQKYMGYPIFFAISVLVALPVILMSIRLPWAHPENN